MCNKEQGYHQSQIDPDVAAQLERADWEPEEALRFYADGKHFDIVDGQTRILDTGGIASNALKSASLEYLERKGDAELFELRATVERQAAQIEMLRDFIETAPVSTGVCCCGESMEGHSSPMNCGHTPVDLWDHSVISVLSTTPDQALAQFAAKVREQCAEFVDRNLMGCREYADAIRAITELPK